MTASRRDPGVHHGRGPLLAFDTATRRTVVALGDGAGPLATRSHDRSGPPLLDVVEAVLRERDVAVGDLAAVVVGTGPGSFTGLRIALATAKTLAYAMSLPIVGVPTVLALAHAAGTAASVAAVVLPAGARDHYLARVQIGEPGAVRLTEPVRLVAPGTDLRAEVADDVPIGVEVDQDALGSDAIRRGSDAREGLAGSLLAIGAARLAAGAVDDVAMLVPGYVALPRGVTDAAREVAWSPDLR